MSNVEKREYLRLTLKKEWFDLMQSGRKSMEFRKPSKWIMSRLNGKSYEKVLFRNGYGAQASAFEVNFLGWFHCVEEHVAYYDGELSVKVEVGDIIIMLGSNIKVLRDEKSK